MERWIGANSHAVTKESRTPGPARFTTEDALIGSKCVKDQAGIDQRATRRMATLLRQLGYEMGYQEKVKDPITGKRRSGSRYWSLKAEDS